MYSSFETEIIIRPDDIDMNNHVHNTKYLDYVLAARYDQMQNSYKMSMSEFIELGLTWVVSTSHIEYKRALKITDKIFVRTQLDSYSGAQAKVNFWIIKKENKKVAAEGYLNYTLISTESGKPIRIPEKVINKYTI